LLAFGLVLRLRPTSVEAKRLLPHFSRPPTGISRSAATGRVSTSIKFRNDHLAIIISFTNLTAATKIDYLLSYNTRGAPQGASGTLIPAGENTTARELLFGNCSKGVCRYDTGISNAKLTITSYLRSGIRVVKRYRLKV
jgi:hypothetical protein